LENIVSIGTDLVSIDRIRELTEKYGNRFLERIYTRREIAESSLSPAYLSGRFAVKEAVLKAMGTGLSSGLNWRDVETIRMPSGAPTVCLYGEAARRVSAMGSGRIMVSISHERAYALAFVVFLGESP
jgi:holo-[acyl-carrier protein] synthase